MKLSFILVEEEKLEHCAWFQTDLVMNYLFKLTSDFNFLQLCSVPHQMKTLS